MTTNDKPFIMEIDEAEKETIEAVNSIIQKHNLPCYVYEMIFDKVHRQLKDAKNNELSIATTKYNTQKKESAENGGEECKRQ